MHGHWIGIGLQAVGVIMAFTGIYFGLRTREVADAAMVIISGFSTGGMLFAFGAILLSNNANNEKQADILRELRILNGKNPDPL